MKRTTAKRTGGFDRRRYRLSVGGIHRSQRHNADSDYEKEEHNGQQHPNSCLRRLAELFPDHQTPNSEDDHRGVHNPVTQAGGYPSRAFSVSGYEKR